MLREQHHLRRLFGRNAGFGARFDRLLQTLGDRQPLARDTHTLEFLGPGLGLRLGNNANLPGLGFVLGSLLQAGAGVDLVHGRLDFGVGLNVVHQGLKNRVAEVVHNLLEPLLDRRRDLLFLGEDVVDRHFGNQGADRVEHVGRNLLLRVHELVLGGLDGFLRLSDEELHRDQQLHEDVILGFRFDFNLELAHAMRDPPGHRINERPAEMQPRAADAQETPKALHHRVCLLLDGEEAAQQHQHHYNNNYSKDHGGHAFLRCKDCGLVFRIKLSRFERQR